MDREQTKFIIRKIHAVYQNSFKIDDVKFIIDTWHEVLEDYDFDMINDNLKSYLKSGAEFPPKIGQLTNPQKEDRGRSIPTVEETRQLLQRYDEMANGGQKLSEEERQEHLRKMRIAIGIEKEGV